MPSPPPAAPALPDRPGTRTWMPETGALVVRWHKRQFACRERSCPRTAFTESIAELPPYARITGRTRRAAGASIGSGRSVRAVCGELPMRWPTAHAAFVKTVVAWLDERREDWKARVRFVAIDPCATYRSAVEHALGAHG
jgi:hypothetical protein